MNQLWHLRLVKLADLPTLAALLPAADLEAAALTDASPDDQLLLALPITANGQHGAPLGCIRIRRNIGLREPRYWYHLGCVVHAAAELGLFHRQRTLLLGNDHTGATELADLAIDHARLDPQQQQLLPRLLVRAALLLLLREQAGQQAAHPTAKLIAALPGPRSELGAAPFWEGLGRHFYPGDVARALSRFGSLWFTHVAALLPRHPVVVSLLHADAQAAIGAVHPDAYVLRDALHEAGLRPGQHVMLYDGGPVYEAHLDLLPGAGQLKLAGWRVQASLDVPGNYLIASTSTVELWLVYAQAERAGELALSAETAQALGLQAQDQLWQMPLENPG